MNTGALIVASPASDDPVNTLSTEDAAHITMLWFGEAATLRPDLVDDIREALDDVCSSFGAFVADVAGVAMIGPDKARVLLVESDELAMIRNELGALESVREARANAEKQFPFYVPHLTLGYEGNLPTEWPESIKIDALGLWLAGEKDPFPLSGSTPEPMALESCGIPVINCLSDLNLALLVAAGQPEARWYVEKRARALGAVDRIPVHWRRELASA